VKFTDLKTFEYMAVQPKLAGLDEVQQMFLAFANGNHVALSGPPGVGKTTLVEEFASRLGIELISRVMGPKVNESLLISYPDLVQENGVTVTKIRPGLLAQALQRNCIYFADEIDRLTEDNQKLHNSAFDNRKSVTMRDGERINGGNDFFGVVAYNPTEGLKHDLESALADRFVHLNFQHFAPKLEAFVSLQKAGLPASEDLAGDIQWKVVRLSRKGNQKQVQFYDLGLTKDQGVVLTDLFKGKQHDLSNAPAVSKDNQFIAYRSITSTGDDVAFINPSILSLEELSIQLSEFCHDVRSVVEKGTHSLGAELLSQMQSENEDVNFGKVQLHLPSSRILQAALKQYHYLTTQLGMPNGQAQVYTAMVVINQVGYGKFGTRKLGGATNKELLMALAGTRNLIPMRKQRPLSSGKTGKRKGLKWGS